MMRKIAPLLLAVLTCAPFAGGISSAAPSAALKVAVIGDGRILTVVLDQSAIPCGPSPYPAPCQYQDASPLSFPSLLSSANSNAVDVLASLGTSQGSDPSARSVAQVLQAQVPHIARDAGLVIVAAGDADVSTAGGNAGDWAMPLQRLASAIRAQAPHARIVFLGLRDVAGVPATTIVDWNARMRGVATSNGDAFIDMRTLFPATDYPDFPDAVHPSSVGSKRIADAIAATLHLGIAAQAASPSPIEPGAAGPVPSKLAPLPSRKTRLNIAVIGSSMERNVVLDGSPVPCGLIERAAPCSYEDLSPLSYPTFLGALVNATIYNLSVAGSQAADAKTSGTIPSALESQVPQIPADADVVILQIGLNDTSISGTVESVLHRIDEVVDAVRARTPNAHIIFVGLRDYGASVHPRIDAWNARELHDANLIGGTVVDIRSAFPATDYADFPDGTHASVMGSLKIAQILEAAIDKLRAPSAPK